MKKIIWTYCPDSQGGFICSEDGQTQICDFREGMGDKYGPQLAAALNCLSASEAVYGFAGWLTTRKEQSVFSATDDTAPAARLCGEFIAANSLPEPREGWEWKIEHPKDSEEKPNASALATGGNDYENGRDSLRAGGGSRLVRIGELYVGDRFILHRRLYTLLDYQDDQWATCRVHGIRELHIPGTRGDGTCSIRLDVEVTFQEPNESSSPTAADRRGGAHGKATNEK
jgi:hypothetical protein